MTAEDISVSGPALLEGVQQRAGDVLLPGDIGKTLRAVFTGENLVCHE